MEKKTTQMIKGMAIIIMITHHFIVMPFIELPYLVTLFGYACKICVAIYAVLSGYGYFFAKERTVRYGMKKIWGLLQIYWISLFTLFIPAAISGGWELTPWSLIVQLFGLLPNLNWFAWYVFFYIFCMLVMPVLYKYKVFRFKPLINLAIMIIIPTVIAIVLQMLTNYRENTIINDLYSCFLYFPCFLVGYWMAENRTIERINCKKGLRSPAMCIIGIVLVFVVRITSNSIVSFSLDVFYAPLLICMICILVKTIDLRPISMIFKILGKYSTGMWFFHAVFFSTYISEIFQPVLLIVKNPFLMYVWLILLSLSGAFVFQKLLIGIKCIPKVIGRRS